MGLAVAIQTGTCFAEVREHGAAHDPRVVTRSEVRAEISRMFHDVRVCAQVDHLTFVVRANTIPNSRTIAMAETAGCFFEGTHVHYSE
jgi:hypothetical protein